MAKAMIEPQEVMQFAAYYAKFNSGMRTEMTKMNGAINSLAQNWRDQEFAKFAQQFEEAVRPLARFLEEGEEQVKFLRRKAEKAQEYLDQR